MSIITYVNVDTPVFEIDYLRYIFSSGETGLLLSYQPDHLYADVDKTVPATIGGGIASFDDLSGNSVTGPQPVSTARPILRDAPARGEYDSADDVLPSNAVLPAITDGAVILIGQQGIWIDEGYSFAGGNWSFGPTAYTGGPEGIIGVVGDMLDLVVLDRPLTADERDRVVAYGVKRGSAGLIARQQLVMNGDFSDDLNGWTVDSVPPANVSVVDGAAVLNRGGASAISARLRQSFSTPAGANLFLEFDIVSNSGGGGYITAGISGGGTYNTATNGSGKFSHWFVGTSASPVLSLVVSGNANGVISVDNICVYRYILPGETP